ncbi:MAG: NRDE family protein, partial [Phycisphaerales bacterium]
LFRSASDGSRGLRLVTSRDESVHRPDAIHPDVRDLGGAPVAYPVDPPSGGAWVGVNHAGLALTLLNLNPVIPVALPAPADLVSRGTLIPQLLRHDDGSAALEGLHEFDLHRFAPFRLVAATVHALHIASWDRSALRVESRPFEASCFVSSGLGDHLVEPRLALFASWRSEHPMTPARQDAFHAHRWPLRQDISVRMRRDGARTRSVTTVEVREADGVGMRCHMTHTDDHATTEVALQRDAALATSDARG